MSIAAMPLEQHPYNGTVCDTDLPGADRHYCVAMHLSPFGAALLSFFLLAPFIPLIFWLVRKDESPFVDDHGREVVNFTISFFLWHVILAVTVIGLLLLPVLWIVALVSLVRAALAGSRGEYFRYPVTFRFL